MQTMAVPTPSIAKLGATTLHTGFGTNHFACMRTHAAEILSRTVPSPLGWEPLSQRAWHAAACRGPWDRCDSRRHMVNEVVPGLCNSGLVL
jgi:hypothetical protein